MYACHIHTYIVLQKILFIGFKTAYTHINLKNMIQRIKLCKFCGDSKRIFLTAIYRIYYNVASYVCMYVWYVHIFNLV